MLLPVLFKWPLSTSSKETDKVSWMVTIQGMVKAQTPNSITRSVSPLRLCDKATIRVVMSAKREHNERCNRLSLLTLYLRWWKAFCQAISNCSTYLLFKFTATVVFFFRVTSLTVVSLKRWCTMMFIVGLYAVHTAFILLCCTLSLLGIFKLQSYIYYPGVQMQTAVTVYFSRK